MTAPQPEIGRGEPPWVNVAGVVLAMGLLLGCLLLASLGLAIFFPNRIGRTFVDLHAFPPPGVTTDERRIRIELTARQQAQLEGGDGRLPIEAAMKIIAALGPQAFDPLGIK